jgi:acyl-CoA reductase-like NAD-dependent aldehyde dehydrogenase
VYDLFAGSTLVGERIAAIAAPMMKKLSLELGGKNAAIVFGDADLEKAVPTLIRSCFLNQGEICLCTSRLFVHESIYDTLVAKLVTATNNLQVGDPNEKESFVGAINSKQHYDKVRQYIRFAVEDGGSILCGEAGEANSLVLPEKLRHGYFLKPTVIAGLADDSRRVLRSFLS